jgi:Zn-dependent protease
LEFDPVSFQPILILQFVVLILALSLHEMAHAWASNRLGDPTAARLGRLTLNPRVHIDPIGTIFLPLLLMLTNARFLFGWAKPTPVDPNNLRHPRRDHALVAAAGPLSNFLLAIAGAAAFRFIQYFRPVEGSLLADAALLANLLVELNVLLALFNLLPLPPLDGGALVVDLMPDSLARVAETLRTYGVLVFLILIYSGFVGAFLQPLCRFLAHGLLGSQPF